MARKTYPVSLEVRPLHDYSFDLSDGRVSRYECNPLMRVDCSFITDLDTVMELYRWFHSKGLEVPSLPLPSGEVVEGMFEDD